MATEISRRDLLRLGVAAGATASLTQAAFAGEPVKTIRIGFIGVGGRGTSLLGVTLGMPGVAVPAVCDIDPARVERAQAMAEKALGKRPEGYANGPTDYRRLLARDDIDAVLVATPMQLHARMCAEALRAGKHVLSEVAAAVTLDECWDLVHAAEESRRVYMLAENVCYYRQNLMLLDMVRRGLFGDLTYADCGYVHDCRSLLFGQDGALTWRGELSRAQAGNWYPTHAIGPVAQWLGIHHGDRLASVVSVSSREAAVSHHAHGRFGQAWKGPAFAGDSNQTLIRTAKGVLISLRFDVSSPRPVLSTTHFALQGTKASYDDRDATQRIWLEGRSQGHAWDPLARYDEEFAPALWRRWEAEAKRTGHGGADFFVITEFLDVLRTGRPAPIDVYDAAAWSSLIPLSAASVLAGGKPQEVPDFTGGKWAG